MHMDSTELKKIADKYLEGTTTLDEERNLKNYVLSNNNLPEEYEHLAISFRLYTVEQENQCISFDFQKQKNRILQKILLNIASIAAIALLIFKLNNDNPKTVYVEDRLAIYNQKQEELIYNQTLEALSILTVNLEKGSNQLKYLGKINQITTKILKAN